MAGDFVVDKEKLKDAVRNLAAENKNFNRFILFGEPSIIRRIDSNHTISIQEITGVGNTKKAVIKECVEAFRSLLVTGGIEADIPEISPTYGQTRQNFTIKLQDHKESEKILKTLEAVIDAIKEVRIEHEHTSIPILTAELIGKLEIHPNQTIPAVIKILEGTGTFSGKQLNAVERYLNNMKDAAKALK